MAAHILRIVSILTRMVDFILVFRVALIDSLFIRSIIHTFHAGSRCITFACCRMCIAAASSQLCYLIDGKQAVR